MLRKQLFLILIALCFYISGCGEESIKITLHEIGAAPSAFEVVGPVPDDIKEILWGKDVDTLMAKLETALVNDSGAEDYLIHAICYRREREAYYQKYIDAGGIAIMGNAYIDDRIFYAARDITLGMTQKRPELRELLAPSRENRPGATVLDTMHDVTQRPTPGRRFRMVLVHNAMSATSVPEWIHHTGVLHYRVPRGLGEFSPSFAWSYVGGYSGSDSIWGYETFSHELAHAIHAAIRLIDPTFDDRLQEAYEATKDNPFGLTTTRGSATEYWAHAATDWFSKIAGRQWYHDLFLESEPLMYVLLSEWFDLIDLSVVKTRVYE